MQDPTQKKSKTISVFFLISVANNRAKFEWLKMCNNIYANYMANPWKTNTITNLNGFR